MGLLVYIIGVLFTYLLIGVIQYRSSDARELSGIVVTVGCALSWLMFAAIIILWGLVWLVDLINESKLFSKLSPVNLVTWIIKLFKKNDKPKLGKVKISHDLGKKDKSKPVYNKPTDNPNAFDVTKSHWEK